MTSDTADDKSSGDDNVVIGTQRNIAVIKQKCIVDNGKIAAVLIRKEEVTLKKINFDGSLIKLIPANPAYKEKIYSRKDIEVYGELTGIIRKYN